MKYKYINTYPGSPVKLIAKTETQEKRKNYYLREIAGSVSWHNFWLFWCAIAVCAHVWRHW